MHKDLDKAGVSNSSVFVIGFIITCYFILLVIARAVFITECRVINCVTCLLVNMFCNETCIYLGLCILERSRSAHELTDTVGGSRFQFQTIYTSDRPILIFYNRYRYRYLYVYVTDNRYSEPIFIYCYKVNK